MLDSDYYNEYELLDEDDGRITIVSENVSEKEMLEEENMSFEELQEKYRPYYEKAKKQGFSYYIIGQDD